VKFLIGIPVNIGRFFVDRSRVFVQIWDLDPKIVKVLSVHISAFAPVLGVFSELYSLFLQST
jgi:hypothetical protein